MKPSCTLGQLDLHRRLVLTPSFHDYEHPSVCDERAIHDLIESEFADTDCSVETLPLHDHPDFQNDPRRVTVARRKGRGPVKLRFGIYVHTDQVQPSWPDPFVYRVEGDKIYGPATGDMKGGVMVGIEVLKTAKIPDGVEVFLFACPDEERKSRGAKRLLLWKELGLIDGFGSPEISSNKNESEHPKTIIHSRRGNVKTHWHLAVSHQAHGAGRESISAATLYERLIGMLRFRVSEKRDELWRVLPGSEQIEPVEVHIERSDSLSVSPEGSFDLRHFTRKFRTIDEAKKLYWSCIAEIVLPHLEPDSSQQVNIDVELLGSETSYDPYETSMTGPMPEAMLEAAQDIYGGYRLEEGDSVADGNIIVPWLKQHRKNVPYLDIGPLTWDYHSDKEYTLDSSLALTIAFYRHLIEDTLARLVSKRSFGKDTSYLLPA